MSVLMHKSRSIVLYIYLTVVDCSARCRFLLKINFGRIIVHRLVQKIWFNRNIAKLERIQVKKKLRQFLISYINIINNIIETYVTL